MYSALVQRDSRSEGVFFVGVRTTGVFCRPTCSARKPRRENVEFFQRASDALHAGYRPCKRCRPLEHGRAAPQWVEQLHARLDADPATRLADRDLRALGVMPTRARAYFKQHYGMTFHAYARARRLGLALREIRNGKSPDRVGATTGYESLSGFRDAFARVFGQPVGRGREINVLLADWIDTPLGAMLAIACDDGLCLLEFVDRRAIEKQITTLRRRMNATVVPGSNAHLSRIREELKAYFDGRSLAFRTPIVAPGSEFQQRVWSELRRIAPGETRTYAQLAKAVGRSGAHRAVGRANGDNRIALVIPCHRIIATGGALGGYGGKVWRKQWLLNHEASVAGVPTFSTKSPRHHDTKQ
ncbi:MAG: bifunctional transcriptional activator/DNA repair protein Ada [Phycisphaerales bacterium]|nr:bifunctional transcriptional activator/DNA repair protein Ada [Phycisphaerales bacterium]